MIWFFVIGFLLIFLCHILYCVVTISSETITVSDKGIVVNSCNNQNNGITVKSSYMVYTTNGQAIKNTNNILFWKWNSDELQAKLRTGKKYKIKTWGIRVPLFGIYKHIISATEIKVSGYKKSKKKSK
jgi:hypothetical protein